VRRPARALRQTGPLVRFALGPPKETSIATSENPNRPRVLILGGGYAAAYACRALRPAINAGKLEATVVTRENFQCFHGFVAEMVTGRVLPSNILSPVRRIFPPARVHVAEIERIDLRNRAVVTSRSIDGARFELGYDQLLISLGSTDRTESYPGLAEHAFRLKTYEHCLRLKNHILTTFELADIEPDPVERRRLLTFFIAGGGYAGTELAGELADLARILIRREYSRLDINECRFVVVHPGPTLLPELYGDDGSGAHAHPRLVEFAMNQMRELGVEVMTNTRVVAATPNEVNLSNGERIPTRTIVSAVGTKMPRLVELMDLPKDERGRLRTDRTLRVVGSDHVWAAGDCAAVPKPGGGTCPPVAIYAMKCGFRAGKNIERSLDGRRLRRFRYPGIGQGASVGRRSAVAELKGVEISGLLAWLIWRLLLTYYFPTWDRRLRLLADWLIWPIVGRDVVALRSTVYGDYDIRHNVFQAGEVIAEERRTGRYIHIIVEGEVELLHQHDAMEQVLRTLGKGDSFGTRWLESLESEVARAKTEVRTLAVRRDQAPQLQDALLTTARLVAESGHFPAIVPQKL
jgi:NADH dehydrogenase